VINYFYLVVGILCVLFAGSQTWNGLQTMLPALHGSTIDSSIMTVFIYQWYIIIAEQLVFGIALIIMAFQKSVAKIKIAAWVITAILFMRGVTTVIVTVLLGISNMTNLLISAIAIFSLVALMLLGNRVRD
jgi:hypothetical protein